MSKKIYTYKGKMPSFALPILGLFAILAFLFFLFFGAIAFLFIGALGIGYTFLRKVFGKPEIRNKADRSKTDDLITLDKKDYEVIDIED